MSPPVKQECKAQNLQGTSLGSRLGSCHSGRGPQQGVAATFWACLVVRSLRRLLVHRNGTSRF